MPVTSLPIAFTASSSSLWRRPVMKTRAPSSTKSFAIARPIPSVPPVTTATFPCNLLISSPLFLDPLLGKRDGRPAIGLTLFVQAAQAGKQQMRRRDQDVLAREPVQQSIPCQCSCGGVGVEDRRDLGMLQLDALCMDNVAPEQDLLPL